MRKGDTLSGIAHRHSVGTGSLAQENGITHPDRIRVGQKLRIPKPSLELSKNVPRSTKSRDTSLPAVVIPVPASAPAKRSTTSAPLGSLSAKYESRGGVGAVSSGYNDPGGISYGTYQYATNTGDAAKFVASPEFKPWAHEFANLKPGTSEFGSKWRSVAERSPAAFLNAQYAFMERSHYLPVVKEVFRKTGFDLDNASNAIRNVTWSVSVQHGGAAVIIDAAIRRTDNAMPRTNYSYERLLIDNIYDQRSAYMAVLRDKAVARNKIGKAMTFQSIINNRYPSERRDAQAMLRAERLP